MIDFNFCLTYSITCDEYIVCHLLYNKEYDILNSLLEKNCLSFIKKDRLDHLNKLNILIKISDSLDFRDDFKVGGTFANHKQIVPLESKSASPEYVVKEGLFDSSYESMFDEFVEIYPKKEGSRMLHNLKQKSKLKYISWLQCKSNPIEAHSRCLEITCKYIDFKEEMSSLYRSTKNREYWIEAYPLLSTYINNLDDKLNQYESLLKDDELEKGDEQFGNDVE